MYTLLEEKKSSSSKVYVAQRAAFLYLLVVVFFFFPLFSNLLLVRGNSLAAPTCWRLLKELLTFSRQHGGTKKAGVSRKNLDLIPQETFLKFLVMWSWILFTYERSRLSLLPSIKPQCTILFFALYSFYWASIVSKHNTSVLCFLFILNLFWF